MGREDSGFRSRPPVPGLLAFAAALTIGLVIAAGTPASALPTSDAPSPVLTDPVTPPETPTATETPTAPETPTDSPTPAQSPSPTTAPPPASPTAADTPTTDPVLPQDEPEPTPPVLRPVPPALAEHPGSPLSWGIAAVILGVAAVLVMVLRMREKVPAVAPASAPVTGDAPTAEETLAGLEAAGEAMLDAGHSVTSVELALLDIAGTHGFPDTEVVVLPTALFISSRTAREVRTGAVASGQSDLTLAQIDAVDDVVSAARTGELRPAEIRSRIDEVRAMPSPYPRGQRVLAYLMLSAGLAVLLGASWTGTALAAALGLGVGSLLLLGEGSPSQYKALITVALSFAVSTIVLVVSSIGLDPGVLPSLIAPLVILLPGGLLTTGVIELSTGQMMSGAGRLAAGFMQLGLLAAGVVTAAALVGVPRLELTGAEQPIGPLGPWVAVAVFGTGTVIYRRGRPNAIPWVVGVLYVAYGAQVIADLFVGGVMSAFIAAFIITPMTILVARQPSGPAPFVSFLPAFWMLVPGALGLVGVAGILDGDAAGLNALSVTASTMLAIALGSLAGSALSGGLRRSGRWLI